MKKPPTSSTSGLKRHTNPFSSSNLLFTMRATTTTFCASVALSLVMLLGASGFLQAQDSPAQGCYWLNFDGTNDYVSVPNQTEINFTTGDFTIAAWIKPSALPAAIQTIVNKRNTGVGAGIDGYLFYLEGNQLRMLLDDGVGGVPNFVRYTSTNVFPNDGDWHHVAAVIDRPSGGVTLYIDGVDAVAVSDSDPLASLLNISSTSILQIGASNNTTPATVFPFGGGIDDVGIWRVALSAAQVGNIASGATAVVATQPADLRAYWDFEEGSGTSTNDEAPSDATANNGTLVNMDPATDWEGKFSLAGLAMTLSPDDVPATPAVVDVCGDELMINLSWTTGLTGDFTINYRITNGATITTSSVSNTFSGENTYMFSIPNLAFNTGQVVRILSFENADEGCTIVPNPILERTFNTFNPPTASISAVSPEFCEGSSTTFSSSVSNGVSFLWSASVPGATFDSPTMLNPGALTVDLPDGSPITTVDVTLTVTGAGGCRWYPIQ